MRPLKPLPHRQQILRVIQALGRAPLHVNLMCPLVIALPRLKLCVRLPDRKARRVGPRQAFPRLARLVQPAVPLQQGEHVLLQPQLRVARPFLLGCVDLADPLLEDVERGLDRRALGRVVVFGAGGGVGRAAEEAGGGFVEGDETVDVLVEEARAQRTLKEAEDSGRGLLIVFLCGVDRKGANQQSRNASRC